MGIPDSLSIAYTDSYASYSPYYGWWVQDSWRLTSKWFVNPGLRLEYEQGPTERYNRMIGAFDPAAALPIAAAAQAAYARNPLPERPAAYQLNPKTVIRMGYGMFYDTLNAGLIDPNQLGYSRTAPTNLTNNFGATWLTDDLSRGLSPRRDPFPVRSDGARFDLPVRDALGNMAVAGGSFSFVDLNTPRPASSAGASACSDRSAPACSSTWLTPVPTRIGYPSPSNFTNLSNASLQREFRLGEGAARQLPCGCPEFAESHPDESAGSQSAFDDFWPSDGPVADLEKLYPDPGQDQVLRKVQNWVLLGRHGGYL